MTVKKNLKFNRNQIVEYLESLRIQTRNLFSGNIVHHPCFFPLKKDVDYRISGTLENTNKIMNDCFWIGVYPGMNAEMLEYMIDCINNFVEGAPKGV